MNQLTLTPDDGLTRISCSCSVPPVFDVQVGQNVYVGASVEVQVVEEGIKVWRKPWARIELKRLLAANTRAHIFTTRTYTGGNAIEVRCADVTLLETVRGRESGQ